MNDNTYNSLSADPDALVFDWGGITGTSYIGLEQFQAETCLDLNSGYEGVLTQVQSETLAQCQAPANDEADSNDDELEEIAEDGKHGHKHRNKHNHKHKQHKNKKQKKEKKEKNKQAKNDKAWDSSWDKRWDANWDNKWDARWENGQSNKKNKR
jgi:hypothetical protein